MAVMASAWKLTIAVRLAEALFCTCQAAKNSKSIKLTREKVALGNTIDEHRQLLLTTNRRSA